MREDEITGSAEDLELEGSDSESIVGGRVTTARFKDAQAAAEEVLRLSNEGYVETACMAGGTLMENKQTKHRIAVKFG
jgi:hypothetical protein